MFVSPNGNIIEKFNFFRISGRCNPAALVVEPPMNYNFVRFIIIDMQLECRKVGYFETTACSVTHRDIHDEMSVLGRAHRRLNITTRQMLVFY